MIRLCLSRLANSCRIAVHSPKILFNIFSRIGGAAVRAVAFRVSVSKCKLVAWLVLLLIDSLHRASNWELNQPFKTPRSRFRRKASYRVECFIVSLIDRFVSRIGLVIHVIPIGFLNVSVDFVSS